MVKLSQRSGIAPFYGMQMSALATTVEAAMVPGEHVLHLEVGQPSGGAALGARRAAAEALLQKSLGYTPSLGLPALRDRIAQHYADWYGVTVTRDQVLVTAGASAGFVLAFLSCFDVGDKVAVTEPGYLLPQHP